MLKFHQITFITFCLLFTINVSAQFKIPDKPTRIEDQTSVYDYVNLLSPSQKQTLEQKLIKYSDTTSTQIVLAIISSTEGEYINYLGTKWAHKWGIGQAKEDNGVFILLAKDDRKIGINSGYGVEHLLTDAMSKRIINNDIIPYFKQGDYYGGLNNGIDSIFKVLNGEYHGTRQSNSSNDFPIGLVIFLIFVFLILLIAISKNRGGGNGGHRGNRSSGSDILEAIILSNMGKGSYRRSSGGFGGFGGSSSSGGGFSSGGFGGGFGGGGFGGGGASGSW